MKNFALLAIVGLAASANAQSLSFVFPGGNTYNGGAAVKVELWASYTGTNYAWAGYAGAVNGDATGEFSNAALAISGVPGTTAGTPGGGNVGGIIAGQLHFPPVFMANTANPILIWSGEWSTGNLTARTVDLSTSATKFEEYVNASGVSGSTLANLKNASGTIEVVPAPSALALLGLGGLVATRRRR